VIIAATRVILAADALNAEAEMILNVPIAKILLTTKEILLITLMIRLT
jgi:hypothetical protein